MKGESVAVDPHEQWDWGLQTGKFQVCDLSEPRKLMPRWEQEDWLKAAQLHRAYQKDSRMEAPISVKR